MRNVTALEVFNTILITTVDSGLFFWATLYIIICVRGQNTTVARRPLHTLLRLF